MKSEKEEEDHESRLSLMGLMDAAHEPDAPVDTLMAEPRNQLIVAPSTDDEERHLTILNSKTARVEELSQLYASAHGKQLEHLMRQVRSSDEVPLWVILAMTSRMMRATEPEQCDILNAMASTGHDDAVCHICRELHEEASPRLELAMVSILGQRGDRRDYQLLSAKLEKRNLSQELKVALKRSLAQLEARHPEAQLAMASGGLTLSAPVAEEGALTMQQGDGEGEDAPMSPAIFDRELLDLLQHQKLEMLSPPATRRIGGGLLERQEYDWLELRQGPHVLKNSVLFALIWHEIAGWPASLLVILFILPLVLGGVVLLATQVLLSIPIMAALSFGLLRQKRRHYEQIFERGELFIADVSFPDGGERAALDLTSRANSQRPALRRHVRLSRSLAAHYKEEPELRGVVLWDEEGGGMLILDDYTFLAIDAQGDIVVRRSSSVLPGMILSGVMGAMASLLILLIFLATLYRILAW